MLDESSPQRPNIAFIANSSRLFVPASAVVTGYPCGLQAARSLNENTSVARSFDRECSVTLGVRLHDRCGGRS
jgi:hypothetical protein